MLWNVKIEVQKLSNGRTLGSMSAAQSVESAAQSVESRSISAAQSVESISAAQSVESAAQSVESAAQYGRGCLNVVLATPKVVSWWSQGQYQWSQSFSLKFFHVIRNEVSQLNTQLSMKFNNFLYLSFLFKVMKFLSFFLVYKQFQTLSIESLQVKH